MWLAFEELAHHGYLEAVAVGGEVEIKGRGILLVEQYGLADPDRVAADGEMRTNILEAVAKARDEHGRGSFIPFDVTRPEEPFDEKQRDFNVAVLIDAGLLSHGWAIGSIDITDYGLEVINEWRKRASILRRFEDVEHLSVEERAERVTSAIEDILQLQEWTVVSRHESGVLAQRFGQFYRFRCRWEDEPLGTGEVGDFLRAILAQPTVRGVVVSWSGFTDAAKSYAVTASAQRPIVLVDKSQVERILATETSLDDLVDASLSAIIHYHEAHPMGSLRAMSPDEPEDLVPFLRRFRGDHPDPSKCAFIMMRFGETEAHTRITKAIKETLQRCGLEGVRADDRTYAEDIFPNIRTYLHGCGFGIAVFERLTSDDFNPNVSLEVGYMFGMGKPVCLLKDSTLRSLHTDLVGRLYTNFDPQRIEDTLPGRLEGWLRDRGIVAPAAPNTDTG